MAEMTVQTGGRAPVKPALPALSLAALGIVFGDIGTSPLYTLKTVLDLTGSKPEPAAILGALSLIIWTLIIVTSIKYVALAMRVDNDGEGGILALTSLLGLKRQQRPVILAIGLFGAALIYGDGAITPAISVLSALEGLKITTPAFQPYVVPGTILILVMLFAVQRQGTARIGKAFGPIMALWFVVIGLLGLWGIFQHPSALAAIDPRYGLTTLFSGGWTGFLILGGVFLCVTGAEALYADMGHFGAKPIRLAWSALVLPTLVLNYAGQTALVLAGAPTSDNIFFRLCPSLLLAPMVLLSTIATIIASQSIITGAFSMTRQAIQLGWLPRLPILQTSAEGYGQIYVGAVNWLLMLATLGLVFGFGSSDRLASAYGIAVSLTMLMTSVLLFFAMREVLHWPAAVAGGAAAALMLVDSAFVAANLTKFAEGGYVPVGLAVLVYGVMTVWHHGAQLVSTRLQQSVLPIDAFMAEVRSRNTPRVPGTAVFLTRTQRDAPPILRFHLKHTRSLHERVLILTVATESVPYVADAERLTVEAIAPDVWRARARFGFMDRVDVPAVLRQAHAAGCGIDLADVTYFLGHENVVVHEGGNALSRWMGQAFAFMLRNSAHVTDYFQLPDDTVVELGREIVI